MRLVLAGLAVLLLPLAAAAQSTPRYVASLEASVVDNVSYVSTQGGDECTVTLAGSSVRRTTLRSVLPTAIRITRVGNRLVYTPSRLDGVQVSGIAGMGSYTETRRCRDEPVTRSAGDCRGTRVGPVVVRAVFRRPAPNRIRFRSRVAPGRHTACGLGLSFRATWLDAAPGAVAEIAFLNGAGVVRARGRRSLPKRVTRTGPVQLARTATVTWTITFRRIDE